MMARLREVAREAAEKVSKRASMQLAPRITAAGSAASGA